VCVTLMSEGNYHFRVVVIELSGDDIGSVTALWADAGLTRPWNNAVEDFRRAIEGPTSAVLGIKIDGELIGTVMVGHDGHRGWVYYLCVSTSHQRVGLGSELMRAAEQWLRDKGAVKIQLMVRSENESAMIFYARAGYEPSDVNVLSRWLSR
jgi:ribosomal protein S18 acetylase RimI-like enzyme